MAKVERKNHIGNFEIDTVIGRYHIGALVTMVDRKPKYAIIKKERKFLYIDAIKRLSIKL